MTRPLIVAAHGTASVAGRQVIENCAARVRDLLRVPVQVGYVDVCGPTLIEVLHERPDPVVVPLFLASGYHVRHDVPAAVADRPGAVVTPALGTAPAVIEALATRLREAIGGGPVPDRTDGLVLASAGSTREAARTEVEQVGALLAERLRLPVDVAFLSGPGPRLDEVCAAHRAAGRSRLAVATHLLAPGVFLERARLLGGQSGVVTVADELGSHPAISTLVAARYTAALGVGA